MLFFFNDTATTEIYTLSLHDALPICAVVPAEMAIGARLVFPGVAPVRSGADDRRGRVSHRDRKSTRLNSSHQIISYAVFCLKKKNNNAMSSQRISPPQRMGRADAYDP